MLQANGCTSSRNKQIKPARWITLLNIDSSGVTRRIAADQVATAQYPPADRVSRRSKLLQP